MEPIKVKITRVKAFDKKADGTPLVGKYGPYWRISILTDRFGEEWLSGFGKTNCADWEGTEKEIIVTEKESNGKVYKNFDLPKKTDEVARQLADLNKRVFALEMKGAVTHNEEPKFDYPSNEVDPKDIPF